MGRRRVKIAPVACSLFIAPKPFPHKLFNAGLDAKKTRAIDFREGDTVDVPALKDLIRAAVAHNVG